MGFSAYLYVNRGEDYDFPYQESIRSVLWCDEVFVGTDPRFDDGTLERLREMEARHDQMHVISKAFDYDHPNPHGQIKQELRDLCQQDWLLELDADEIFPSTHLTQIRTALSAVPRRIKIIGIPEVHLFNGMNRHLSMPPDRPILSRNDPRIKHTLDESNNHGRWGACYITDKGQRAPMSYLINTPPILHLGWYSLPRRWEMKQTLHYYQGRLQGTYANLAEYTRNLDSEDVDFWDIPYILPPEHYLPAIRIEMYPRWKEADGLPYNRLKRYRDALPAEVKEWAQRQAVVPMRRWLLRLSNGKRW